LTTQDPSHREEAATVEQALQGDPAAFEWIVRRYHDRLWRVVWRIVGDEEQAARIVQEAFLAAHAAIPIARSKSPVSIWLLEIAVGQAAAADGTRRATPPARRPRAAPSSGDEAFGVERCLATLDRSLRLPLALGLEGLRYGEIAQVLHLPLATVRSRLYLARDALAKCIRRKRPDHG
jgi:RNA polymerase sigma-70 factor (ECF subfamily)